MAVRLRRYFDFRFERVESRIEEVRALAARTETLTELRRSEALAKVDVATHNAGNAPPRFSDVVSQVVSAAQFEDPEFQQLAQLLTGRADPLPWRRESWPPGHLERKLWEWCFILKAARQYGKLVPAVEALGFGVGSEPIPAALAQHGVRVLATDRGHDESGLWAASGQHMESMRSLSRPHLVSEPELERLVRIRYVDMNDMPDDLGTFDLIWSSCSIEHLGSPQAGIAFVLRSLEHLRPGGLAVHTTELELTRRSTTADYGELAVYRIEDLEHLGELVRTRGFDMPANWYVAMDAPEDRWISFGWFPENDVAHLKLVIGDSVSTSVGLLIAKPL